MYMQWLKMEAKHCVQRFWKLLAISIRILDRSNKDISGKNLSWRSVAKGQIITVVDSVFLLMDAKKAHDLSRSQRAKGKVILRVPTSHITFKKCASRHR